MPWKTTKEVWTNKVALTDLLLKTIIGGRVENGLEGKESYKEDQPGSYRCCPGDGRWSPGLGQWPRGRRGGQTDPRHSLERASRIGWRRMKRKRRESKKEIQGREVDANQCLPTVWWPWYHLLSRDADSLSSFVWNTSYALTGARVSNIEISKNCSLPWRTSPAMGGGIRSCHPAQSTMDTKCC